MAQIIVTGGQGFLGRNLVEQLVYEHNDVCSTFNYTPPAHSERTKNLSHFRCDVTQFDQVSKLIMQEDPEIVYHLVAQPIVTAAGRAPLLTFELTTRGTWNVLDAIRLYGKRVKVIVFVSSDKVYGNNGEATEHSPLNGIDHPYNVAKVAADVIAQSFAKAYDLPVVISRSANLYGPYDYHWDRIVPGISRDIIMNRSPIIRSNGRQARDYIWVGDGVRALMHMAEAMYSNRIERGEIFNFGSSSAYTASYVTHALLEISGRTHLKPVVLNGAKDEIEVQHISYEKATAKLGWRPLTSMQAGLEMAFDWYKKFFEQK